MDIFNIIQTTRSPIYVINDISSLNITMLDISDYAVYILVVIYKV